MDALSTIGNSYQSLANVRVDFYDNSKGDLSGVSRTPTTNKYHQLYGFLTDEGLDLSLQNNYDKALDFNILQQAKEFIVGAKGLVDAFLGDEVQGYITSGIGGNIILNAPYYWQGTEPISFTLPLYQIADTENDIMINYQRIMEILSPGLGSKGGEAESIQLAGSGPGVVYVHYFPEKNSIGQGRIIFGPCLCREVSMKVAPPYSKAYMPIVGIYNFRLQVSRIMDRSQIKYLFNNPNDPGVTKETK